MCKKCMAQNGNCNFQTSRLAPLARLARGDSDFALLAHGSGFLKNEETKERNEPWLTSTEAAAHLGISLGSLRNKVSNGTVPRHKLGRLNRFLRSELDRLLLKSA